jgi:O-antigen ligase
MTRSRASIVSSFLACGYWLFFASRKFFGVFVGSTILSAVIITAYFPQYIESLNEVYVRKGSTDILQSRQDLLRDSWEAAMESPLIGVGFGVSKGYSEDWEFGLQTGTAAREKGNSYLALLEEVGVVGSASLVLSIGLLLIALAQRLRLLVRFYPSSEEFWTTLTLSACLAGGLADAFFEAWLTAAGFFSAIIFWLVFGVLTARLIAPLRVPR